MTFLRTSRRYLLTVCFVTFLVCGPDRATARIGEKALQFVDRYGPPRDTSSSKIYDKNSPLIEGAIHHVYEYQGWKIRAAFLQLDGPAVRMEFSKRGSDTVIKDYELQAIVTANTPMGMSWNQIKYNNADVPGNAITKLSQAYFANAIGEKMWRRTDGVILWLRSNLSVRLELPAAHEYEAKLKLDKDRKSRASVPQF